MPSYNSKLELSPAGVSGNIILMDIDPIKGAFAVYTSTELNAKSVNYFSDGQLVYVSDSGSLFKANVTPANPPISFEDTVTFSAFSFNSGSFVSASFNSSTSALTLFGEDVPGSTRVSMSVDLSSLEGGGITTLAPALFAEDIPYAGCEEAERSKCVFEDGRFLLSSFIFISINEG